MSPAGRKAAPGQAALDRAARRAAVEDLEHNLFVEAAAGTGKTTLLVNRLVELVRRGKARLGEAAAITFTEKAAGELLERVRERLEELLSSEPPGSEARARFEEALRDVESAPISTIHSLASEILRERPVEAGLDPRFAPLDALAAWFEEEEAWEAWLPAALEADPGLARRALRAGVTIDQLRGLASFLLETRGRAGRMVAPAAPPDFQAFLRRWEDLQKTLARLAPHCHGETDDAFRQIGMLAAALEKVKRGPRPPEEALEKELRRLKINLKGNQKNWTPRESCTKAKEVLGQFREAQEALLDAVGHGILFRLVEWLEPFVDFAVDRLRERGRLTFHDLLVSCRDLLRDDLEVRRHFQRRFRAILVDEFQDTDPLQAEIAFFLAEEEPRAKDWREVRLAKGKLFIVGDPKQSIYRFRGADIELYEEVKALVKKRGGKELTIQCNYRSTPGVIDWVNQVFLQLMPGGETYQPNYVPLVATLEPLPGPAVEELRPAGAMGTAAEWRREEAARVAELVLGLHGSGGYSWKDFGILFPRAARVDVFEEALRERGIPYHLDGGKEFFRRVEVAGVLNCLDALDQPEDRIALVGALRSALLGHTDAEILELEAQGGKLSYLVEPPPPLRTSPLASSLALLRSLHEERDQLSFPEVMDRLVDGTGAAAAAALRRRGGLLASQNLKKLGAFARKFESEGGVGLGHFARWLRQMGDSPDTREAESPTFEEQDDVVRLLTVHKAKGLQYRVVVLVNLGTGEARADRWLLDRQGLHLRLDPDSGLCTTDAEQAWERDKARREAERCRLLYVAATRARERLVISRVGDPESGELKLLAGCPSAPAVSPSAAPAPPPGAAAGEAPLAARLLELHAAAAALPETLQRDYLPPRLLRPSAAGEEAPAAWVKGDGGVGTEAARALGAAVHRALELVELSSSDAEVRRVAGACAAEMGIAGRAEEVCGHVLRALGSRVLQRARLSPLLRREMPLLVPLPQEEGLVVGTVDLVFEDDGGLTIVDYKTDRLKSKRDLEAAAARHEGQVRLYARALRQVTGRPVREAVLLFTATAVERRVNLEAWQGWIPFS